MQAELEARKQQQPAASFERPEAADLLNKLKGRRKKSKTDLADVESILSILEGCDRE